MLKIDSRSRSDVGRIAFEEGPFRFRPRKFPPTIRMRFYFRRVLFRAAFLLSFHRPRAGDEEGVARPGADGDGRACGAGRSLSGSRNGAEKSAPASRSTFSPICSRSTRIV